MLWQQDLLPEFVHKCDCQSHHTGLCLPPGGQQNTVVHQQFLSSSQPFSANPTGIKNMASPKWFCSLPLEPLGPRLMQQTAQEKEKSHNESWSSKKPNNSTVFGRRIFIDGIQLFSSLFSSCNLNLSDEIPDQTSRFQWATNQSKVQVPRCGVALWKAYSSEKPLWKHSVWGTGFIYFTINYSQQSPFSPELVTRKASFWWH